MDIRPIRDEKDYQWAVSELDKLFGADPGTPEADKLDVLIVLIEAYEREHHQLPPPDPIEAIKYWMETRGLSRKDLEPYIGSRARVAEIMNRKRPLTLRMIRNLENGLGIPARILVQEYPLAETVEAPERVQMPLPEGFASSPYLQVILQSTQEVASVLLEQFAASLEQVFRAYSNYALEAKEAADAYGSPKEPSPPAAKDVVIDTSRGERQMTSDKDLYKEKPDIAAEFFSRCPKNRAAANEEITT